MARYPGNTCTLVADYSLQSLRTSALVSKPRGRVMFSSLWTRARYAFHTVCAGNNDFFGAHPTGRNQPSSLLCRSDYLQVSEPAAAELVAQLQRIDVELVNELFTATMAAGESAGAPVASRLQPARGVTRLRDAPAEDAASWHAAGLKAIAAGQMGALTLAGGQGTRLGSDRPKGEYDIGLPSHKSLFQLQAERITRLKSLAAAATGVEAASVHLPWYVMTSPMTDADTRAFLAEHRYFGLPADDVMLFSQGTLPCLDFAGKIMLETGSRVAEAPDGNGGIYRALHSSGVVADMVRRGVIGVHVFAVDNAIVRVADPTFFGYCLARDADVGSKVCAKAGPHEKVGVLCLRDGAYSVVEYSEMDKATAELTDPASGELLFNAGNLCIHYYSRAFLEGAASPAHLPKVYHVAKKAIPYAHPETGATLSKEEMAGKGNTGIKLESFIFDVFPSAERMAVLDIDRAAEFAPVKNAPGSPDDSPDTARAALLQQGASWVAAAGATVSGSGGVEVSPLVSYGGEGLAALSGATIAAPAIVVAASEEAAVRARVPAGVSVVVL